ncbi:hypothetical protein B566_EDAN008554 [Ephemera danica]|nr:hypothetical protein B566_EDAN008554 [Ephemera danica]
MDESIAENSKIRSQDARSVHTAVYSNYLGVDLALDFIILNWERCVTVYSGANNLQTLYDDPGSTMDPVILTAIGDSIVTVEESIVWHETHSEVVLGYLNDKFPPTSGAATFAVTPALLVTLLMALWWQY